MKYLLFSIFIIIFPTYLISQEGKQEYKDALTFIKNKKYKKALKSIDQAILLSEKDTYISQKTFLLIATGSSRRDVIKYLNKKIESNTPSPLLLEIRGAAFKEIYRYQDAILDYTDALKLAQNDSLKASILGRRADLYNEIQKLDLAKIDFEKAYMFDSTSVYIWNNFSIVLDRLGEVERSKSFLKKIIEQDSLNVPAIMNIGFFASKHGEYEEALMYLNKALVLEPSNSLTLNNISFVKLKLGKTKEALKDVNKSLKLDKTNSYAYKNRALIYLQLEENNNACIDLKTAIKYSYTLFYGKKVEELIKKHCIK